MQAVQVLVENGNANVNCKDQNGNTPLHVAATLGDIAIASYLLEHRALTSETDHLGRKPLDVVRSDFPAMKQLIRKAFRNQSLGDRETTDSRQAPISRPYHPVSFPVRTVILPHSDHEHSLNRNTIENMHLSTSVPGREVDAPVLNFDSKGEVTILNFIRD